MTLKKTASNLDELKKLGAFVFMGPTGTPDSRTYHLYEGNRSFNSADRPETLASIILGSRREVCFLNKEEIEKTVCFHERCRPLNDSERRKITKLLIP